MKSGFHKVINYPKKLLSIFGIVLGGQVLKSIASILVLFSINSGHAQSLEAPFQLEAPGIDIDLSTFKSFNNVLYWPKSQNEGDYQVSVSSFPYAPLVAGSTIKASLNSFNSGTYLHIQDIQGSYMTVWYTVSIPIVLDTHGKNLNKGAFLTCRTSDGKIEIFSGVQSKSLKVESNTQSTNAIISIACSMGLGYRADIIVTKIQVEPQDLNLQISALDLRGADYCQFSLPDQSDPRVCQSGKIKAGQLLNIPFGANLKLTLLDKDDEIIPAKFELVESSLALQSGVESYSLFPNQLAVFFNPDVVPLSQSLITVHLGSQKVKITPLDGSIAPFTITLNSVSSETIGDTYNTYDEIIIARAHQIGIPPQYIKGQVEHESGGMFNPSAYRYEPITNDMKLIQPKISDTTKGYFLKEQYDSKRYGKYLFRPKDRLSTNLDLIDLRSLYKVQIGAGTPRSVPIDYETTVKKNSYTPLYVRDLLVYNPKQNWGKAENYNYYYNRSGDKIAQTIISSSYGLMQIMYTTALDMGYTKSGEGKDPALLLDPETNITLATKYLVKCIHKVNEFQESGPNPQMNINELNLYIQLGFAGYNKGLDEASASEPDYNPGYRENVFKKSNKYLILMKNKIL